jgi:hypothetical protein
VRGEQLTVCRRKAEHTPEAAAGPLPPACALVCVCLRSVLFGLGRALSQFEQQDGTLAEDGVPHLHPAADARTAAPWSRATVGHAGRAGLRK